jgi:hypothetical protein
MRIHGELPMVLTNFFLVQSTVGNRELFLHIQRCVQYAAPKIEP